MKNTSTAPSTAPRTSESSAAALNRRRLWPRLATLAGILLAAWLAARQYTLPAAKTETAPETEFSAARAMAHLPAFATAPRPAGSAGHENTRNYLMAAIRKTGLEPQLQETASVLRFPGAPGFSAGTVKNVIARLPGTGGAHAIALDAHYDGASTGPAAADCGSGVITLLETIRVLKAGPPLKNDVIFVFADAEEVGDLGAHAFATQHPWMEKVRLALNYEAMGARGPAYLYVTSVGNRRLIEDYARVAPRTVTNSFVVGLFNLFPEQRLACDLQDYLDEGSAGYGFVFSGNSPAYHTRLDNIESLSPRTIQQLGDKTMGLLRHFGNAGLENLKSEADAVFFALWPGLMIHYPATLSLPLAILALALLLAVAMWGVRRKKLSAGKVVLSTLLFLAGVLLATALTAGAWAALKTANPNLQVFQVGNWGTGWYLGGLLLLAATLMAALAFGLRRRLSFDHQAAGVLLGFALLAVLLGAVYPIGNYLFLWPALAGVPALPWLLSAEKTEQRPWGAAAAVLAVAIPAIVLIVPVMAGPNPFVALLVRLDAMAGMPLLAIDGVFAALLTGLLIPLLGASDMMNSVRWLAPIPVLALGAFAIGWAKSGYSPKHPRPEGIRYELDANTGQARWVTGDAQLGEWTSLFIPPENARPAADSATLLFYWPATFAAPAPILPLEAPTVTVTEDFTEEGRRMMRLWLQPQRPSATLQGRIQAEGPLLMAALEGETLEMEGYLPAEKGQLTFNYAACPQEGIELMLLIEGTGPLSVTLANMSDGLPKIPGQALPGRPETTMPALLGADATVVRKGVSIPAASEP
ncbi:MAG: M28 family peptidase [Phaeodactylibacter sp.]|nr:M28 family peptidase [Phaeodactylibacter sp.]